MSSQYARFRHLAIESAKPAPTKEQFDVIEDLLCAPLPASFREFLKVANGGYLEYVIDVPFGDGKLEKLSFCSIFSAEDGESCGDTFVGEIRSRREYQMIPPGVLPFAQDGGGSTVFLDLSPEGNGRVIAFVQGLPEWTGLRTKSEFIEIASSFDEYVAKHHIDRGAIIDHLTRDATNVGHVDAIEEWLDIGLPTWRKDSEIAGAFTAARCRVTSRG